MDWHTIQFTLLAFGIGLMLGALVSYFFMRQVINKNIEPLSRHIIQLKAHNKHTIQKIDERRENLVLLANKLRQIEKNLQKIRRKEFDTYLDNLNALLSQKGITCIDDQN